MAEPATHHHEWFVGCRTCDTEPNVADHFVNFTDDGWSIEHSLECRMSGEMQRGCDVEAEVRRLTNDGDPGERGRFLVVVAEGTMAFEQAS